MSKENLRNEGSLRTTFKGPSNETLAKRAQQTTGLALKYARAAAEELGIERGMLKSRINMGPIKTYQSANQKAADQYDGDRAQINDYCRLQLFTHNKKEMEKVLTLFSEQSIASNKFHKTMHSRGKGFRFVDAPKDYVRNPKRWGWMGVKINMETSLGKGRSSKFEIQVFDIGMREAYDTTHALYDQIKPAIEDWEKSSLDIHEVFNTEELAIAKEILRIHREAAIKCGLYDFTDNNFPEIDDPVPLIKEEEIRHIPNTDINDDNIISFE